jgi:EAL domain-containing protein (putative c-di-GMP-specific phosphodiesterase class I)
VDAWRARGVELSVAVNLSARCLNDPAFPTTVRELLAAARVPPARLALELTESAIMADPALTAAVLDELHRMGVALSVDDFGTGYSSLAYLQQFPIDLLKIDRSFVNDVLTKSGALLVQAIVQISHTLGLVPVAEGVESQAQADALVEFGCDLAQGFHLGRPADAASTGELLRCSLTPAAAGQGANKSSR